MQFRKNIVPIPFILRILMFLQKHCKAENKCENVELSPRYIQDSSNMEWSSEKIFHQPVI
jgi:hypothetical protein